MLICTGLGFQQGVPRCVTTASKTSGPGQQRSVTNSPQRLWYRHTGFAAAEDNAVAVCVFPGTELSFSIVVTVTEPRFVVGWKTETLRHATAIFRQINKNDQDSPDALEFPDGRIVLLTQLCSGQEATILRLPAQPMTVAEAEAQKRLAPVG